MTGRNTKYKNGLLVDLYFVFRFTIWTDLTSFLVGDKVQNTKFEFFFVIFGATLSRRFARQIFTSFLSRQDPTKLKKQKNDFYFLLWSPQGTIEPRGC